MKSILSIFFLFGLNLLSAQSIEPLVIDNPERLYRLDSVSLLFVDSVGDLSDEDVRNSSFVERFRPMEINVLNGKSDWSVWLKIPVLNLLEEEVWQLVLRTPGHEKSPWQFEHAAAQAYVDVFVHPEEKGKVAHLRTGTMVPASKKDVVGNPKLNAVFVDLPMGKTNLFVKISNRQLTEFRLSAELRPKGRYVPMDIHMGTGNWRFYTGVGFILSLLSIFFFGFVRDWSYLYFACYAACIAAHYTILSPNLFFISEVVPEHPVLMEYAWLFLTRMSYVFFALFGIDFVGLKNHSPWMRKALLVLAALFIVEMLAAMFFYPPTMRGTPTPWIAILMFSMMLLGVRIFFFPGRLAKVYGIGAFVLLSTATLGILWQIFEFHLPFNPWSTGQITLMIIYTLGLALRLQTNERAKAEAQRVLELDAVKSRFFANISHEFRTPLTLILGPLKKAQEQLPASELDQTLELAKTSEVLLPLRHIDMMRRNAERLGQLIDQLLDLSKLENGSMELQLAEGDVVAFVRAMVFSFESLAERRQVHLQTEFSPAGKMVFFDRDKLEKIIVNLLSNAFKYTPERGRIFVKTEMNNGRLKVSVEDSGPGISKEDMDKIFERFYQVEGTEDKGTGIGLSLVKELVELHHGQISVERAQSKGTIFKVSLPVEKKAFADHEIVNKQMSATRKQERVEPLLTVASEETKFISQPSNLPLLLIVEDNPDLRQFIAENMSGAYQILTAENGKLGLETAIEKTPDLIVSDVMMPEMDGFEMCETLKKDERTSHIPIVLLTAKAGQRHKVEGLETGADDYLTKPFDEKELLVRARNLVEQRRKMRERFSSHSDLSNFKNLTNLKPHEVAVTSTDERFLNKVTAAIEENMDNEFFSVEDLASAVAFSRSQLHRKLKALVGKSPNELIREFRLARAKELLEKGHGNVSEVALEVGYSSLSYFTRSFKSTYGILPSEI